jgi:hypothetical protein
MTLQLQKRRRLHTLKHRNQKSMVNNKKSENKGMKKRVRVCLRLSKSITQVFMTIRQVDRKAESGRGLLLKRPVILVLKGFQVLTIEESWAAN